jgi:hypothetical protein
MYNDDRMGDSLAIFVVGSLHRFRCADDRGNIRGLFNDRSPCAANTGLFQAGGPDAVLWKATGVTESVVVGVKR